MQPHDRVRVRHIIDSCREIEELLIGYEKEGFMEERKLQLSIVKLIEIIGEAASNMSLEFREETGDIPWVDIIGMRNRSIHGYFDMDLEIVWTTAKTEVPELLSQLEPILNEEEFPQSNS